MRGIFFNLLFWPGFLLFDILARVFFFAPFLILRLKCAYVLAIIRFCGIGRFSYKIGDIEEHKKHILVCNHVSMFDIPILVAGFRNLQVKFIAKRELARWIPTVSILLKTTTSVVIDRSKARDSLKQISDGIDELGPGQGLVIFPEGTRSPRLGQYKKRGLVAIFEKVKGKDDFVVINLALSGSGSLFEDGMLKVAKSEGVALVELNRRSGSAIENTDELFEEIYADVKRYFAIKV